jgi:hypothetical protein
MVNPFAERYEMTVSPMVRPRSIVSQVFVVRLSNVARPEYRGSIMMHACSTSCVLVETRGKYMYQIAFSRLLQVWKKQTRRWTTEDTSASAFGV